MTKSQITELSNLCGTVGLSVNVEPAIANPSRDRVSFVRHGDAMCVGFAFGYRNAFQFIFGYVAATVYPPSTKHVSEFIRKRMRKV